MKRILVGLSVIVLSLNIHASVMLKKNINGNYKNITTIDVSNNGKFVATAQWSKEYVKILDIKNNKIFHLNDSVKDGLSRDVRISPNNKYVATTSGKTVIVYSLKTKEIINKFTPSKQSVYSIDFHQNNKIMGVVAGVNLFIINWKNGDVIKKIGVNDNRYADVYEVEFSPNGKFIAVGSRGYQINNTIKIFDTFTGNMVREFKEDQDIFDIEFINNNLVMTSDYKQDIKIWNIKLGSLVNKYNTTKSRDGIGSISIYKNLIAFSYFEQGIGLLFVNDSKADIINIQKPQGRRGVYPTSSRVVFDKNGKLYAVDNSNIKIFDISFYDEDIAKQAYLSIDKNSITDIQSFINNYYNGCDIVKEANRVLIKLTNDIYLKEYTKAKESNRIETYKIFMNKYPNAPQITSVINDIYKITKTENKISLYLNFIKEYPNSQYVQKSFQSSFNIAKSKDTLEALLNYINKEVPKTNQISKAKFLKSDFLETAYNHIKKQNNISGYEWFIKTYPKAPQVKEAIKNIHKLAYDKAKDINTISAYNTFIYAYPFATQVRDANDRAYKFEEKKYTDIGVLGGFFQKEAKMEKKARKLFVKAKLIERTAQDYQGNAQAGYIIVANRMYQLLLAKFDDSETAVEYMKSLDFKDFTTSFKQAMKDIKYILNKINENTSDISRYAQESLSISKQGFEDANADRDMSRYKDEQHHQWEKKMHLREKGYM